MAIADGDSVTVEYTGRLDDGTVFDTSLESVAKEEGLDDPQANREYAPLTFEMGAGRVIQGLEDGLRGKSEGDTPTLTIPPEEAYGDWSEENVKEYAVDELTQMTGGEAPEEGAYLQTQDGSLAEIIEVSDETVRVDFNHQLAGETLEFEVEIVDVS